MSGDFSRWSFQSWRDFSAVLMQQGRVHTDADWNEWVSIVLRRLEAEAIDTLGRAVVPLETPDGFTIQMPTPTTLTIGTGRAYVDGLLAENHGNPRDTWYAPLAELRGLTPTPFDKQPYHPGAVLPTAGAFVAYLKVWQRELTSIEAPDLVEKALGVDTTGRYQTVWQVKLASAAAGQTCLTPLESNPAFVTAEPPAGGRMTTGTATVTVEPDPCIVPPGGGYSGIENQLYRVEIHRGGGIGGATGATFKWSRDDASVATRVTEIPATMDRIVVDDVGRDDVLSLHDGEWIEITDDWLELNGLPGEMCQIALGGGVDRATKTVILQAPLPAGVFPVDGQGRTLPERNTRLRRWDQGGIIRDGGGTGIDDLDKATSTGTLAVPTGQKTVLLEHNIVVSFDVKPNGGVFRTGDHWVFAARTADASVEKLDHAPPRGIHAHYAPLALVTIPGGVTDCRTVFPPLGGLDALEYVAGDGQEVTPDPINPALIPLPVDPTAGVARGPLPVAGRTVRFTILAGTGTIGGGAGPLDVLTDAAGLASVSWALDPTTPLQRLEARLLDTAGVPTSLPVRYSARLRTAETVAYDPGKTDCPDLVGVGNVQDAIDRLCARGDHGDCCVTIGSAGEFKALDEMTVEIIAKRHKGHVCLCFLPERHRIEIGRIGGLRTLSIGGRGAVLELAQPLDLSEIADVAIEDVTIVEAADAKGFDRLLGMIACGQVRIESVTAILARGADTGTVVRVDADCPSVRAMDCTLQNLANVKPIERLAIAEMPPMAREFLALSEGPPPPAEASRRIAALLAIPDDERTAIAADLDVIVERRRETVGIRDLATIENLRSVIESGRSVPPARARDLLERLNRLRDRLAVGGPGSAIELIDGGGEVWLESNRIDGGIVLYGSATPDFEGDFDAAIDDVLKRAHQEPPGVKPGKGRLCVTGNRYDWLTTGSRFEGSTLYAEILVSGNSLRGRPHVVYAEAVSFTANIFSRDDERPVGLVFANAATVTGNIGPAANPVLVVSAVARSAAANSRLKVQP